MRAEAEVEDGHSNDDSIGHLAENDGAAGVGDFGVDFDTPVDGARVHDNGIRLQPGGAEFVQSEHTGVFTDRWKVAGALAFVLDAQEHDGVGIGEGLAQIVADAHAHGFEALWHEGAGAGDGDLGPELLQTNNIGAGHPTEENVAEDGDLLAVEAAEFFQKSERVEEGLCRVGVGAVTGIDHGDVDYLAQIVGCAGCGVAHDDHVGLERGHVLRGVAERFSLGQAAGIAGDGDGVGAQSAGGHFKGEACAGARFEEQIHDGAAFEIGLLFIVRFHRFFKGVGGSKDRFDLLSGQRFDTNQVFSVPA